MSRRPRPQWCGYCKGYRDHKEKFCPIRTTEPVMDEMLSRFEHLRPFEGYEYDEPGQLLLGGQFRIYVVCMSSGINWPYRKLNADFTTFYEGPGRVDLPDPETDNGMYDAYRFHDYTCGYVCNRIFANARDIGGLNAIAERNKQLLRALIRHISTFAHGRPRGTVPQEAFRVLDCCRQGRHRAALFAFLRFCWLVSHGLAVQLRHCSLFLDIRGPCGCGTPDGYCRVKGGNERENKRWVQTHSEWRFRIAKEYITMMNDWCADELEDLRNVISQHGPRPVQQDVIHPPQQLLPLEDPREYPTVAETVVPKAVVKKAPQAKQPPPAVPAQTGKPAPALPARGLTPPPSVPPSATSNRITGGIRAPDRAVPTADSAGSQPNRDVSHVETGALRAAGVATGSVALSNEPILNAHVTRSYPRESASPPWFCRNSESDHNPVPMTIVEISVPTNAKQRMAEKL